MANAIEDALNRASSDTKQAIENLKSKISSVEKTEPTDLKGNLNKNFKEGIESAEKGPDNYLHQNQNVIDRAQARATQQPQKPTPEPDKER